MVLAQLRQRKTQTSFKILISNKATMWQLKKSQINDKLS